MAGLVLQYAGEKALVPAKFAGALDRTASVKAFSRRELSRQDNIFSHLASGGVAITSGPEDELNVLDEYVQRRSVEIRRAPAHPARSQRPPEVQGRLMVLARGDNFGGIQPSVRIPYLSEFVGEAPDACEEMPLLVPLARLRSLQKALEKRWQVRALDTYLVAGEDVFPPKSQETSSLFHEAIAGFSNSLPKGARVLDMGCGSGVLALIAATVLRELDARVTACDLLPEAVASTRMNVDNFVANGRMRAGAVTVAPARDLFAPVGSARFDLLVFNAPWVVAPIRSRAEISSNDPGQATVTRFLQQALDYLLPEGRALLGYADNSGEKALARVKELASLAGFDVVRESSVRVQTHRRRRKWQRIYFWELRQTR